MSSKLTVDIRSPDFSTEYGPKALSIDTGNPIARKFVDRDPYVGPYNITPSSQAQVFATHNLRMTEDIIINPIPQNYGLVTWNGSVLTIT